MPAIGQTVASTMSAVVGSDDATAAETPVTEPEIPAEATPETEAPASRDQVSLNP